LYELSAVERPTDSNTQVRRTWGPSSLQKKDKMQHRQPLSPTTNGWVRWSRSAPNLPKTLSCMGDQSVIKAFTDLGLFLSRFAWAWINKQFVKLTSRLKEKLH